MRSPGLFAGGLVMLLLLGLPGLCFWGLGLPFVVGGIVMMVIGGKSGPVVAQQNYQQVYYSPPVPQPYQQPTQRVLGSAPAQPQSYPQQPPAVYGEQPRHPDERWRPPAGFP